MSSCSVHPVCHLHPACFPACLPACPSMNIWNPAMSRCCSELEWERLYRQFLEGQKRPSREWVVQGKRVSTFPLLGFLGCLVLKIFSDVLVVGCRASMDLAEAVPKGGNRSYLLAPGGFRPFSVAVYCLHVAFIILSGCRSISGGCTML